MNRARANSGQGGSKDASTDDQLENPSEDERIDENQNGTSEHIHELKVPEEMLRITPFSSDDGQSGIHVEIDKQRFKEFIDQLQQEGLTPNPLIIPLEDYAGDETDHVQTMIDQATLDLIKESNPDMYIQIQTPIGTINLPVTELSSILEDSVGGNGDEGSAEALHNVQVGINLSKAGVEAHAQLQNGLERAGITQILTPLTRMDIRVTSSKGQQHRISYFDHYMKTTLKISKEVLGEVNGSANDLAGMIVDPDTGHIHPVPAVITINEQGQWEAIFYLVGMKEGAVFTVVKNPRGFIDIPNTDPDKELIETLASKFIVQGVTKDTFAPDEGLSRAHLTAILARALGYSHISEDTSSDFHEFSDVHESDWYTPYIRVGYRMGLVEGYGDNTFQPDKTLTLYETAVMIYRAMQLLEAEGIGETTITQSEHRNEVDPISAHSLIMEAPNWAQEALTQLFKKNILKEDMILEGDTVNRREGSIMIYHMLKQYNLLD